MTFTQAFFGNAMQDNPRDIYYLGYYAKPALAPSRHAFPSAVTKMDYVMDCLGRLGYRVICLSMSPVYRGKAEPEREVELSSSSRLILLPSAGRRWKLDLPVQRLLNKFYTAAGVFRTVPRGATVVAYHSLAYSRILRFLKRFKGVKLILEVEESYSDVSGSKNDSLKERRIFDAADGFICSSPTLLEAVDRAGRPSCVAFGSYLKPERKKTSFRDGRTHAVYSGTFDRRKKGALNAVAASDYLGEGYVVHVIGFGSKEDTDELERLAEDHNRRGGSTVEVLPALYGDEYTAFLQKCDIGLSSQAMDAEFVGTSFPSKILVYLANGLKVVSGRLASIRGTLLESALFQYSEDDPKAIAACIENAAHSRSANCDEVLERLDEEFLADLQCVLSE